MIDGERKAGKHRNEDAAFPWSPFLVCPDRPMDDRITNLVLHFHIIHDRPGTPAWSMSKPQGQVAWTNEKEGNVETSRTYDEMKNWFSMYTKCSES